VVGKAFKALSWGVARIRVVGDLHVSKVQVFFTGPFPSGEHQINLEKIETNVLLEYTANRVATVSEQASRRLG